jgi:hypothetical protein
MRNHHPAAVDPPGRHAVRDEQAHAEPETVADADDDRSFRGRRSYEGVADPGLPLTSSSSASQRFRAALEIGNPRLVRSAAAELPDLGIAESAAILLVIERTEPENYERTALRWLAKLSSEGQDVDLSCVAQAATALQALPHHSDARASLAEVCRKARLPEAASVFAAGHRRSVAPRAS